MISVTMWTGRSSIDTIGFAGFVACFATLAERLTFQPGDGTRSAAPDALLLKSPAVALESDGWMKRILLGRADAREISPADHVRSGLPPLIIVQGKTDTVTPTDGVRRFCEAMLAAGNRCDLHVFDGVGHLFTPSSEPDDGWPNPDGEVVEDADQKIDAFLESVGFLTSND